jgi:hypothetical protein
VTVVNPVRSVIAVLGGILLVTFMARALELTLVNALADGPIEDITRYFDVRNRPGILAAKLAYSTLAAVLGGYMVAKIAGTAEMWHAGVAAVLLTAAVVSEFTTAEYAAFTPAWIRIALVLMMGPAMLGGAAIRARATRLLATDAGAPGSGVES